MTAQYRSPAVESSFESRYPHRVPVTPYRGAGQPQAVFVIERVLDLVARETGRDRAQVRLANLVRAEDMPWDTGLPNYRGRGHVVLDSGDLPSVLRRALESARSPARRAAVVGGSAVALAAREVQARARLLATRALGIAEADLEQPGAAFADRRRPERRVTFAELARMAGAATAALGVEPGLESTRYFQPTHMTYSSAAPVALVQLDPLSAMVRILGYWISHDSGRLINPLVGEGQLQR